MEDKHLKMFSCKYKNEPADLKLLLIYFIKRIRFVLYFSIIGALLFASVYYLKTYVLIEEREYVATGEMYLVYEDDVRLENVYINDYTWQTLVKTDKVTDYAMEQMKSSVTDEFLKQAVTAGLVSDVRFVTLTVTTNDPDLSVEIAQAYQSALIAIGEEMVDIKSVIVYTEADSATEVVSDDRTFRMACTGAVIGLILAICGIILQYVFDDSIYVPSQFERRFEIPIVGVCLRGKDSERIAEGMAVKAEKARLWGKTAIKLNYAAFTRTCKNIVVTDTALRGNPDYAFDIINNAKQTLEQEELLAIAMGEMKEEDAYYTASEYRLEKVDSINEDAQSAVTCAQADGVLLLIRSGAHDGKLLERAIDLLTKQGCNIVGAVLYDGDAWLLKMYYYEPILFTNKVRQEEDREADNVAEP